MQFYNQQKKYVFPGDKFMEKESLSENLTVLFYIS